jgi:alkanesulfonate monooxygenase SsuD/methylene tetrahydromethanopterin reductase-like flavin-dependent oxidoreductase (luciferase family)
MACTTSIRGRAFSICSVCRDQLPLWGQPLILGILARQTRKVRILNMGTLISLRPDPVRVAEEYATADVISRGRLDIGFVKSGASEMASNNANPVNNIERYWEAIDLVTKALTHQKEVPERFGKSAPRCHRSACTHPLPEHQDTY